MTYRIVVETTLGGQKWYYVQKRILWFFWSYLSEVRDITGYSYRVGFHSLEEAKARIESHMKFCYNNNQKQVIKREYISPSMSKKF